jgi:lysophospholipase L1-like esterase
VDTAQIESNLRAMVQLARDRGAEVVLIGVPQLALFGGTAPLYRRLAAELRVPLEEDTVTDVLRDNALKSDLIHPNAEGYRRIAQALAALLRDAGAI